MLLRRVGLLTEPVINRVSQLAFRYGLPAMLFAGAAQVDYSALGRARYLLAGVLATLLTLAVAWLYRGRVAELLQGIVRAHPRGRALLVKLVVALREATTVEPVAAS